MNSVVVIGARGYTGAELLPLLYRHPEFEIVAVSSGSAAGQPVSAHVEGLAGSDLVFSDIRPDPWPNSTQMPACWPCPMDSAAPFVDALDASTPRTPSSST